VKLLLQNLREQEAQQILALFGRLRGPDFTEYDRTVIEDTPDKQQELEAPRGAFLSQT
jgi:hypothetical protein